MVGSRLSVQIDAETLMQSCRFLTEGYAIHMSNACAFSIHLAGHASGVNLNVHHRDDTSNATLIWDIEITDAIRSSHANTQQHVELEAEAVKIAMLPLLADQRVAIKSDTGTGYDIEVEPLDSDDYLIFRGVPNCQSPSNLDGHFNERTPCS